MHAAGRRLQSGLPMRRVPLIVIMALLTACGAGPPVQTTASSGGFGATAHSFVDEPSPSSTPSSDYAVTNTPDEAIRRAVDAAVVSRVAAAASTEKPPADELERLEADLRARLADDDPAAAALELAALLCDLERHAEAAEILAEARSRAAQPLLGAALASVRRDLGQRHLAVAELRSLRRSEGAIALHPGLLFELAELEWLEGDRAGARATLGELRQLHGESAWCVEHRDELAAFDQELANARAPQRVKLRDLMGNLRGAPTPTVRLATLTRLLEIVDDAQAPPATRALKRRVIAIGCGDASAAVRAKAIQFGPPVADDPLPFCRAALSDHDAFVRQVAARRTVTLLGEAAVDLLLDAMQRENDGPTVVVLHTELANLAGMTVAPPLDVDDAAARRAALEQWRQRWRR